MEPIDIKKWHTEEPLFALVLLISTGLWILLCVSIIGIIYAAFIGVFFFLAHLAFIAHVRGNAVKLGPNQFPELYNRIHKLSDRINLNKVPDAYIMQAGGALNALATKLFASNIIILYSDLLDACEDNESARDMIIGHELGHVKAGHLNLVWFLFPGLIFPFIGQALSRAREYTCDQYGAVLSGDKNGALLGLAILAAGAQKGPQVNLTEMINQKKDYTSGFLTIGKWLSTHPPLCDRISVLAPELNQVKTNTSKGNVRAFTILLVATMLPIILSAVAIIKIIPTFKKAMAERQVNAEQAESTFPVIIDEKNGNTICSLGFKNSC